MKHHRFLGFDFRFGRDWGGHGEFQLDRLDDARRLRRVSGWHRYTLCVGAALVTAGVAGEYWDRLWMDRGILDSAKAPSCAASRLLDFLMIGVGLCAIVAGFVMFFRR